MSKKYGPVVIQQIELKDEAPPEEHGAARIAEVNYEILKAATDTVMQCGTSLDVSRALSQVPPGRSLANEYLRLRGIVEEQQRQIVRATELRVAADVRAGRKNVHKLEDRIRELEAMIPKIWRRASGKRVIELERMSGPIERALRDVIDGHGDFSSCAHKGFVLHDALTEHRAPSEAFKHVSDLFGQEIEQPTPERVVSLKGRGLLPYDYEIAEGIDDDDDPTFDPDDNEGPVFE